LSVDKLPIEFNRTKRMGDDGKCIVYHCNGRKKNIFLKLGLPANVNFNFEFKSIKTDLNGGRKLFNYTYL
jgi:hypothetical protein